MVIDIYYKAEITAARWLITGLDKVILLSDKFILPARENIMKKS